MNRSSRPAPRFFLRTMRRMPIALAIAAALAAPCAVAQLPPGTLPSSGSVVSGSASITTPTATLMKINQTTQGAIINWNSFSVGSQASVTFNQPGATSVTLNRDLSGALSDIEGSLTANGRVFIVNPAGVLFGADAHVNVGGLVASTLAISDSAFTSGVTSGTFVFGDGTVTQGNISNAGTITVPDFGTVALLGGRVENDGTITTPQGTIALAAGSQITLNVGGDGLTDVVIEAGAFNGNGVFANNIQTGTLAADGGQVLLEAAGNGDPTLPSVQVANDGMIRAQSLQSRNGRVVLSSTSPQNVDSVATTGGTIDVSGGGAGVAGGSIALDGYNVGIFTGCAPNNVTCILLGSTLDASGVSGGGIDIEARNVVAVSSLSQLAVDAAGNGNGGTITVNGAGGGARVYGSLTARGGSQGGNGGSIETSGAGIDVSGTTVDTSAPNGQAGTWTIDPYDVTIVHGAAAGTLPTNPFDPIATSIIQDGDINNALNAGSSVTITTGSGGPTTDGSVTFDTGVLIDRNAGTAPLTFRVDANTNITNTGPFTIESTAGPLNVIFDSNANGANDNNGDITFNAATLRTNGGSIAMFGENDPAGGFAQSFVSGLSLTNSTLDTGVGAISLRGTAGYYGGGTGVELNQTKLSSSTGNIDILGVGTGGGSGVSLNGGVTDPATGMTTTSGHIAITGVGSSGTATSGTSFGLSIVNYALGTTTGAIDLRGYGAANGTDFSGVPTFNAGLVLDSLAVVGSTTGNIWLTGSSAGSASGVSLIDTRGDGVPLGAPSVSSGTGNIVVRAHNDGTTDALVLDGNLTSTGAIDLRPGSVDTNGNLVENAADAITLGGATGFGISAAELANISATNTVFGSDIQSGAINVTAPITYVHNLTLQDGAGEGIAVNGALNVGANTLTLAGAGNITQASPITAASLLAQSTGGSVLLDNAGNTVSSSTLAGSGASGFSFVNSNTVGIGTVNATGFTAGTNAPEALSAAGVGSGGNAFVQALTGNMILNGDVNGANVDLVSAGIFDNADGNAITASGAWRVWGNTWTGETRSGLAGSGTAPNLYGCTFGAACTSGITVPTTDNHFIYTQRPTLTVDLGSSTREYGLPNSAITYGVTGIILGDQQANALTGTPSTTATQGSAVGTYPITGTFSSPVGYLINTTPGSLAITPATLTYVANPFSRLYGDPNGTLAGTVTGFRLSDTLANATTGSLAFTTPATQGSNVGTYAIDGGGLTATNYVFVQDPGNAIALTITPATLTYVANPLSRLLGTDNGPLTGTVTGFHNGDTLTSATTGTVQFNTTANIDSPVGFYPVDGSGLGALNYVFVQDPGNATALDILPPEPTFTSVLIRDPPTTYIYDHNFDPVALCPAIYLLQTARAQNGDNLAREWSRVRSRPNLANCVSLKPENACDSF